MNVLEKLGTGTQKEKLNKVSSTAAAETVNVSMVTAEDDLRRKERDDKEDEEIRVQKEEDFARQKRSNSWYFWLVVIFYLLMSVVATVFLTYSSGKPGEWNWGIAIFIFLFFHIILSFQSIAIDELGALNFYGQWIGNRKSGVCFVFFGLVTLEKETKNTTMTQFPPVGAMIWRGDDDKMPDTHVQAIRVTFADGSNNGSKSNSNNKGEELYIDPLTLRLRQEVIIAVQWAITDLLVFHSEVGSIGEAIVRLKSIAISNVNDEFGRITVAQATGSRELHNEKLNKELVRHTGMWGIKIVGAFIEEIVISHSLSRAIQAAPEAMGTARSVQIKSIGDKTALINLGEGEASAIKAKIIAETEGLTDRALKLDLSGASVLAAETARNIAYGPGKLIIAGSGGIADLATMGTVLGETFKTASPNNRGAEEGVALSKIIIQATSKGGQK